MSPSRTSDAVFLPHDQILEILAPNAGRCWPSGSTWTSEPLVLPTADKIIVGRERLAHLRRADVERGHAIGLQPDAHGKGAPAENLRALHAGDRGQPRLDDAGEVVGDLVRLQDIGGEAEIGRSELGVGRLRC